jgi:hypothetical protein
MDVGVEGLQARLRRDLANTPWFKEQVDAAAGWERLAPVPFQTVCIRHFSSALAGDEDALKAHNLEIARRINEGRFHKLAALAARSIMIDDEREVRVAMRPQKHGARVMAARVRAFEADRGFGAHQRPINGHLQRLIMSALGKGYSRQGLPHAVHAEGKANPSGEHRRGNNGARRGRGAVEAVE